LGDLYKIVSIPHVSKDELEQIAEAKASRDILVHNAGIINQIYIQKSGNASRFTNFYQNQFHFIVIDFVDEQ